MAVKSNPKQKKATDKKNPPKVSYNKKPDDLSMDEWQIALRKQYASLTNFQYTNIGNHGVFSDYSIKSSDATMDYKVAIRSQQGMNFCSCMDFKTNNLGTCKHIEHIIYNIQQKPKLNKIFSKPVETSYTSVYLDYKGERKVKIRIGTENQTEMKLLAATYFDQESVLENDAVNLFDVFLEKAHQLNEDFRCYPDAMDFVLSKRDFLKRNQLIDKEIEQPNFFKNILRADLFPYQKQGIEFALRKGKSLIADDMGLGKTIQAIGVAEALKNISGITKVLIICPTSLKYQWKSEIEKFTSSDLQVIEGSLFQREELYKNDTFYKICSYNVVGRDLKTINQNDFDLVILDEAQRIKNWQTITAKNVKKVESKYTIVLTGTPIENKLEELYSLVQMVNPYKLGSIFRFVDQHQILDETTGKIIGYKDLNQIGELLQDTMIRRHKRDVLKELPSRMDKNLFVPMTERQLECYADFKESVDKLVNKWIRQKFLNEKDRQMLLINLNRMRMVCDSTFILDQKTRFDTKITELMTILDEVFENGNEKVVVFSQWERMTRLVARELEARNVKFESLNGGVPSKEREILFKNFNNDPESKVFLSTDAGGVGLNLQAASILINLDLPWNPAVLEQRIARIHRMGQKKNVQIINLVSAGTIEEEMLGRLKFKSDIAAGVLDNGDSMIFLGDSKFTQLMKEVADLTAVETAQPVYTEEDKNIDFESPAPAKKEITAVSTQSIQKEIIEEKDESVPVSAVGKSHEEFSEKETSDDLFQIGSSFFGKLMETLSSKEKTDQLVESLVKKDEKTGETYLKIPVKNQEMIENGLKMLGKFFGN